MTVKEAVREYCDHKSKELERGIISYRQERAIAFEMKKLKRYFVGRIVNEIQPEELNIYLAHGTIAQKQCSPLKAGITTVDT